ncbi:hypothetical protein P9D34_15845 [Bacillus swezeyi]|uniref:Uncharacterized protein n=1 Tax=Bacillus swezeyi TaxID=1925020 RepID=A0A1R1Q7I7_9BACI|nr:hypothetical protein [Bacillus swezeyi]MEC1261886.1 hypothetical protein [Bacillus swezeyi]MED2930275.1 hypothetical protein [Bacillus swezeyi]MED2945043.1 hypothetical protein [Bacillus swezeyi]MED2966186.1 hypothetical protein [Bacillus swezeyi]MED2976824.1 hypothetical protein [Bacillus swezeyi]
MIEKYTTEVNLDFFNGDKNELQETIEEIRAFAKTYENDKITVLNVTESVSSNGKQNYKILLQHERDTNNLGRKYEYDEEKLFGFFEDEE